MKKHALKALILVAFASALSGCAVTYSYEGQKYSSKEEFHQAVERTLGSAVAEITPLASPLTKRKLIFAMPSEQTLHAENVRRFVAMQGTPPVGNAKEIIDNLTKSSYKNIKAFYDAANKRSIYSSVQFVDLDTMNGAIEPSESADALYFVEPTRGSGQWFYASVKHGKQIFAYDRSAPDAAGKAKAFNDALQAQAIKD